MFRPWLQRSLIEGSATRTWNRVTSFTQLLWCKLKHLRQPKVSFMHKFVITKCSVGLHEVEINMASESK